MLNITNPTPFSSTLFRYCAELCHSRSFRLIPVTCPCFAIPFQRRAKLGKAFSSHTQQRPSVTLLIRGLSVLSPNKASLNYSDAEPCFSHTVQSYPLSTLHLSTSLLPRYDSLLFRSQTALRLHLSFLSLCTYALCLCAGFQRNAIPQPFGATPRHFCSLP